MGIPDTYAADDGEEVVLTAADYLDFRVTH